MKRLRARLRTAYDSVADTRRGRAAVAGFGAVAALHLAWQFVDEDGPVSSATQILLMPALAAVLLAGRSGRSRLTDLTLVALGASWLGDSVPRFLTDDPGFLAMVGCFLVAQVAYISGFLPYRARSRPWTEWPARVPYLAAFAALIAWCLPGAGALAPPVIGYGATLTAMALLAPGVSGLAGVGGAVFMASDGLIALHAFADVTLPVHDFWVMLTYLIGQGLIVAAVIADDEEPAITRPVQPVR
ncbi:lysoplasmalogenase [Flexivirga sp. B27]